MLGALGMVVPELLDGTDHVAWFDAGAKIFGKSGIQYLGVPGLINAKNIVATLAVQVPPPPPPRFSEIPKNCAYLKCQA
jgi:light-harvesting complex II chlorophyll a/b binding protein 2